MNPAASTDSRRILVVSNLYPPHHIGGYELVCQELTDFLRSQGHAVEVLTSNHIAPGHPSDQGVSRLLQFRPPATQQWPSAVAQAWRNRRMLRRTVARFQPDLLFVFNPWGLGWSFVLELHATGLPVVHEIADDWLLHARGEDPWTGLQRSAGRLKGPLARMAAKLLGSPAQVPVRLDGSYFRSRWLQDRFTASMPAAGLEAPPLPCLPHGIDASDIPRRQGGVGLVASGRLCEDKGSAVLLEGLSILAARQEVDPLPVGIVGGGSPEFVAVLQDEARKLAPAWRPRFHGHLPRSSAQRIVAEHSIFLFPVVWDEPFGLAPLEAMAAGLAVVATRTGGAAEYLVDEENCLEIPRHDPDALASAVTRLLRDPLLHARLVEGGRRTVERHSPGQAHTGVARHLQGYLLAQSRS